jgi:hypothetical protein
MKIREKVVGVKRAGARRGATVVYIAVALPVCIMFVGLALDAGYVHVTGHQLQNAADAAALAGAAQMKFDTTAATNDAVATAAANQAAGANVQLAAGAGDVVLGHFDRATATFTANGSPLNACKVIARRTADAPGGAVGLFFAPIFGIETSNVSRQAVAMTGGTIGAGVIALHPTRQPGLGTNGNTTLEVKNGGIQVNSSANAATSVAGTAGAIVAEQLRIHGGISTSGAPTLPEELYTNTTPVPDPLAGLPMPLKASYATRAAIDAKNKDTINAQPGYYPGGITMKNGSVVNLAPGMYLLGPPGLSANGGTLNGTGVTLFFTTGPGSTYGTLDLGGGATVHLSPPTSGPWAGITMFSDRNAPLTNTHNMVGNSGSTISGTLYFPSTVLDLRGTSDFVANQVIANVINVSGNGKLIVNYDGRNPAEINNVFLVK